MRVLLHILGLCVYEIADYSILLRTWVHILNICQTTYSSWARSSYFLIFRLVPTQRGTPVRTTSLRLCASDCGQSSIESLFAEIYNHIYRIQIRPSELKRVLDDALSVVYRYTKKLIVYQW